MVVSLGGTALERVVVVGGGLIGLHSAYYLARAGVSVTVLERGHVGDGAARFNAGLVITEVTPLPAPGLMRETLATAFLPGSAVSVSPRMTPAELRFFFRFARHCDAARHARSFAALLDLNKSCFALYDELAAAGLAAGIRDNGYLVCCLSEQAAARSWSDYDRMPAAVTSRPGPLLDAAGLREVEPGLSGDLRAGFLRIGERWIDASPYVDRLAHAIVEAGGRIIEGAPVTTIDDGRTEVVAHSSAGAFAADRVVVAAGIWSEEICRALGVPLGMQAGKGYSFTVGGAELPQRPLYFSEAHAVATPLEKRLRIAGTMQFGGAPDHLDRRRIEAMVRAVSPLLPGYDWTAIDDEWVAPRPMTPDGLPLIGWLSGSRRVLVASGHNMLGLTLGPPTGRLVAKLVCDEPLDVDLQPFAPDRFAGRRARR